MQLNVPLDSHIAINRWARQYGPVFKIFVGHTPVIIITGEHFGPPQHVPVTALHTGFCTCFYFEVEERLLQCL